MKERTYYADNPNLGIRTVPTITGATEYRLNCKKIRVKGIAGYYIINKDCFEVDNRWYRKDSGLIIFDHQKGRWVKKEDQKLVQGIVGWKNGLPQFGEFIENPYTTCIIDGKYSCIDYEGAIESGYVEDFSTGYFYKRDRVNPNEIQKPRNTHDHTKKGYNIEDNVDEMEIKKKLYAAYTPTYTKDVKKYGRMLRDTTFGLEVECSKGFLPEFFQNRMGVVICRDGSLNDANGKPGPEFVTIPLQGYKGLQTVSDVSKELTKRTAIDINCSVHLHIGNIPTTRTYLLSLYKLCLKIQNEIFLMFPYYKANPEGVKKKNYNQKLPVLGMYPLKNANKEQFESYIDEGYKTLFSWLAEGYSPSADCNRKQKQHPVAQKWNRTKRYYWMNLMNTLFSGRNTAEFRIHTPTTNPQKIVNWLFICNAIVRYANTHSNKILLSNLPISLNEILDYYGRNFGESGKFLSEYLKEYVKQRKEGFLKDYLNGDHVSLHEIENDKKYVFTHNNVSHLF